MGFCLFSGSNIAFACHSFHLKKMKIIQYVLLNWRAEEILVVNNKDNRVLCLGTINLIVSLWKFDVLCFKNIKFRRGNYHPMVPRQKCISVQWLEVVYEMSTFFSFFQSFGGKF